MVTGSQTQLYEKQDKHSQWLRQLTERVGNNKASVAAANKNARMIGALLKKQTVFELALAH
jgi:transposase